MTIHSFLPICSHLLMKSLMEYFILCAIVFRTVLSTYDGIFLRKIVNSLYSFNIFAKMLYYQCLTGSLKRLYNFLTEIFYWPQDDFAYDFHVDFAKKTFIDISGNIANLDCTRELNFLRNMNWPFPQKFSHANPVVYSILPITTELVNCDISLLS